MQSPQAYRCDCCHLRSDIRGAAVAPSGRCGFLKRVDLQLSLFVLAAVVHQQQATIRSQSRPSCTSRPSEGQARAPHELQESQADLSRRHLKTAEPGQREAATAPAHAVVSEVARLGASSAASVGLYAFSPPAPIQPHDMDTSRGPLCAKLESRRFQLLRQLRTTQPAQAAMSRHFQWQVLLEIDPSARTSSALLVTTPT